MTTKIIETRTKAKIPEEKPENILIKKVKCFSLDPEDISYLKRLSKKWKCSEAEVVRVIISSFANALPVKGVKYGRHS